MYNLCQLQVQTDGTLESEYEEFLNEEGFWPSLKNLSVQTGYTSEGMDSSPTASEPHTLTPSQLHQSKDVNCNNGCTRGLGTLGHSLCRE